MMTVSVVVPAYNTQEFISECVDSILNQSYREIEVILVDDGSYDKTPSIIDDYISRDDRIKVVHKKNEGVSAARNDGLSLATGDFVVFIDSDDYVREDFIESLVKDALDNNVSIVTTKKEPSLGRGKAVLPTKLYSKRETLKRMFYGTLEDSLNGTQLFRRDLLVMNNVKFDSSRKIGEDFTFLAHAVLCSDGVAVNYDNMYYYRLNSSSAMGQIINQGLMDAVGNFSSLGEGLIENYPSLQPAVEAKKFSDSVSLLVRSYYEQDEWKKDIKILNENVSFLKRRVLNDKEAKRKIRIVAAFYCILGNNLATAIIRRIKQ